MDFMELYAQKKMTAEQAAAQVKSGDWVDYGWAVNTPVAVDAALAKRLPELENVNFRGGILMWVPEIFQIDDPAAHMTWNSWQTWWCPSSPTVPACSWASAVCPTPLAA